MEMTNINNIPKEKFQFAKRTDLQHDSKFDTKPVSYFQGAFRRFAKNKGAVVGGIVIIFLVLFAIIAPLFTPFEPAYYDQVYGHTPPKSKIALKLGLDFWDGYRVKESSQNAYLKDLAIQVETGKEVIKRGEYEIVTDEKDKSSIYTYRYNPMYGVGFGKYKNISVAEYEDIQRYQNETGIQVIYPTVAEQDRPTMEKNKYDANIYYVTQNPSAATIKPKLKNGEIVPNYWTYKDGDIPGLAAEYNSKRIDGDGFVDANGVTNYYVYGRRIDSGVEVRVDYYEYYIYQHTQVIKDGIDEPHFIFGTTATGKDIFACLAYGARFSFIFAIIVAVSNFLVGVIWGSISG